MEVSILQRRIQSSAVMMPCCSFSSRILNGSLNSSGFCLVSSPDAVTVLRSGVTLRKRNELVVCQSSGGTRRDQQKIVARTQHRRARHVKGVTPTTQELMDELRFEENSDATLESSSPNPNGFGTENEDESGGGIDERYEDEDAQIVSTTDGVGKDSTRTEVNASKAGDAVSSATSEISSITQDRGREVSDISQDAARDVADVVQDAGRELADVGRDTAEDTGRQLREALDEGPDNLREAVDVAGEIGDITQDTIQEVSKIARDTADESVQDLTEGGEAVQETLWELGSKGEKATRESISALSEEAEQASQRTQAGVDKISERVSKSSKTVLEATGRSSDEIGKTVETVGKELWGLGEVVVDAAVEGLGISSPSYATQDQEKDRNEKSRNGVPGKEHQNGAAAQKKTGESKDTSDSRYVGLKVLVAGASGRTGRLVVEELVAKGVPVKALVRDVNKFRQLNQFQDVKAVKADLYNYESVKQALGDSNVVICTIGASFPFDPIGTYQVEYEGVLNLIAAAKNQGKVKKFVFVTSLGVTFLQIIPLLFWKKQAELFLQRSGLDYTIIRPGGLTSGSGKGENVEMRAADTQFGGAVSRQKVAEVIVAALITPEASEKVVEVVSSSSGPSRSWTDMFATLQP